MHLFEHSLQQILDSSFALLNSLEGYRSFCCFVDHVDICLCGGALVLGVFEVLLEVVHLDGEEVVLLQDAMDVQEEEAVGL